MRRDVAHRAPTRVLIQPVPHALDRGEDPTRAASKPFARFGVDDEQLKHTRYVRTLPVPVDIELGHPDCASGEGSARKVPVVQNDLCLRAGRVATHDDRATVWHANIQRSARQVHSRRQNHSSLRGQSSRDFAKIFRVQPHRTDQRYVSSLFCPHQRNPRRLIQGSDAVQFLGQFKTTAWESPDITLAGSTDGVAGLGQALQCRLRSRRLAKPSASQ